MPPACEADGDSSFSHTSGSTVAEIRKKDMNMFHQNRLFHA